MTQELTKNESCMRIKLSEMQIKFYPVIYDGMTTNSPLFVDELTKTEVSKLAAIVKAHKKKEQKEKEEKEKEERNQNTFWVHVTQDSQGNPMPMPTIENLEVMLNMNGIHLKYNSMSNKVEYHDGTGLIIDEFDNLSPKIVSLAVENGLPRESIKDYIPAVAQKSSYHPVVDLIDQNQWDGISRINEVVDCFNFTEKEHGLNVMRKCFIGAVAALYYPMFRTKLVPILHGAQSFMKTAALERIFNFAPGAWREGHSLTEGNKDSVMEAVSCWCCELGEIETTTKGEQGWLKALLPKSEDTYRPPYGRGSVTRKRQSVFIGTVNTHDFLRDETGSTRFAVLSIGKVTQIDKLNDILGWSYSNDRLKLVNQDKLIQFWCEIKYLFDNDESWMLSDDQMKDSMKINDGFENKGDYHDVIADYLAECVGKRGMRKEPMTASSVCDLIGIPQRMSRRIGRSLKELVSHKPGPSRVVFYDMPVHETRITENK